MNARRRTLPLVLVAATATLALSACGTAAHSSAGAAGATTPTASASSATPVGASAAPVSAVSAKPGSAHSGGSGSSSSSSAKRSGTTAESGTDSDSYAWSHPCDPSQISLKAVYQASAMNVWTRVIEATNTGRTACGLSYFPSVVIGSSSNLSPDGSPTQFVTPSTPTGIGGANYDAIHAGVTQYAAIDLDPSAATSGGSRAYNELDTQAADFMPNAATVNLGVTAEPSGTGNPYVLKPAVGMYEASMAGAVSALEQQIAG
jgi:hypothetical protein